MRVLGINGSLRTGSHNARLLRAAADRLPPGAELVLFEGLREIPPFDQDAETAPPVAVQSLKRAIAQADAVLIATPEYNHSVPGALKNALDWISRPLPASPLRYKPVLVVGASTGMFGAVWAQAEMRKVLAAIGARVIDEEMPVARAAEAFAPDESLRDPALAARLEQLLEELVGHAAVTAAA